MPDRPAPMYGSREHEGTIRQLITSKQDTESSSDFLSRYAQRIALTLTPSLMFRQKVLPPESQATTECTTT